MQPLEDRKRERKTNRQTSGEIGREMKVQRGDLSLEFEGECRQTVKLDSRAKILNSEYDINELNE